MEHGYAVVEAVVVEVVGGHGHGEAILVHVIGQRPEALSPRLEYTNTLDPTTPSVGRHSVRKWPTIFSAGTKKQNQLVSTQFQSR